MKKIDRSILVVDDDPSVVLSIFEMLQESFTDYTFLQANSGRTAFKVALAKKPNLIITDWDMPDLNGIELIRMLKSDVKTAEIPVIMATGVMVTSEHLRLALEAGATDFLRKPIDGIELQARVNAMIMVSDYISRIKSMNDTIRDANVFLNYLINMIPEPVVYYRNSGEVLIYNDSFKKDFLSIGNLQSNYYQCFNDFERAIHRQKDAELLQTRNDLVKFESLTTLHDGNLRDLLFTKVQVRGQNNGLTGILCIIGDLTDIKKKHANDLQRHKNDLASISMRLIQTSVLNEKIMKDIHKVNSLGDANVRKLVGGIATNYKLAINDKIWVEFEKSFNEVHVDFYKNLRRAHPNIKGKEQKLCAFLKLNMSTKEIASITFQNPKSIDMARYRLRKKLDLETEDSLQAYLSNF